MVMLGSQIWLDLLEPCVSKDGRPCHLSWNPFLVANPETLFSGLPAPSTNEGSSQAQSLPNLRVLRRA